MPVANTCYHIFNRGIDGNDIFHEEADFASFVELLSLAKDYAPMRLLSYCLLPDQFRLVVWTKAKDDLSVWMQWLTSAHVSRYRTNYDAPGQIWQGRFKAFPIQEDKHLLTVMRAVEGEPAVTNTVRVRKSQNWKWSSIGALPSGIVVPELHPGPVKRPAKWVELVNKRLSEEELEQIQICSNRGRPYGDDKWKLKTLKRMEKGAVGRPLAQAKKKSPSKTKAKKTTAKKATVKTTTAKKTTSKKKAAKKSTAKKSRARKN